MAETDLKLVTYYRINFFDLLQMFRDHLGIVVRGDRIADEGTVSEKWAFDNYDFEPADDMYPFGQDTFTIVYPEEFGEDPSWGGWEDQGKFDQYMKQLFDKGLLPTNHPLFVEISW